jgi:ubiquinone/menaquinone biosynthesis C-methylase UbiE
MALETKAFGVEPGYAPYRLRQARYQELGEDMARFAQQCYQRYGRRIELLDVGVGNGVSRMYAERQDGAEHINYHAIDHHADGHRIYKHEDWQYYSINLENGLSGLPSNQFDMVICEQVLEHLHNAEFALQELSRVTKPGGLLVLGVPIFPHGPHLIRKYVVPFFDRLFGHRPRPHVQAFSKRSFEQIIANVCDVDMQKTRGFRIVSGGILRPLEYCRWWWRLNRRIGALVPGLCIEIQVVAVKRASAAQADERPPAVPFSDHSDAVEEDLHQQQVA